jgi:hypothetical protein
MQIGNFGPYWSEVKEIVTILVLIWALWLIGRALARLPKIVEALVKFNELRTPIWDLRSSLETLSKLDIKPQLDDLKASLEAAQNKLNEMQRRAIDEREIDAPVAALPVSEQNRWEDIRKLWEEARDQIESKIKTIDGRKQRKYENITRYSYAPIINQLADDGVIDEETANAARRMNQSFLALRKNRDVSEDNLDSFRQWKSIIDRVLPPARVI